MTIPLRHTTGGIGGQQRGNQSPGGNQWGNGQGGNSNAGSGGGSGGATRGSSPADVNAIPNQAIRNPDYKVQLFGQYRAMNINH